MQFTHNFAKVTVSKKPQRFFWSVCFWQLLLLKCKRPVLSGTPSPILPAP